MESEEINKALHRYVLAVLRARDSSDDLALEQIKASQGRTEFPVTDATPKDENDGSRQLPNV